MDIDEARDFVRSNHRAVFSVARRDGDPAMSLVAAAVDDEGRFVVSSRETAMKTKNARRTGRASLLVLSEEWYGPVVTVDGPAEVVSLPDAMEPLVAYYRSVAGEHDDWDEYRAEMDAERRVVIRITAERAGPNVSG